MNIKQHFHQVTSHNDLDILNFIELAIELSFQRMALTMVVYFSKWKNRCKFYFDQQPRN